MFGVSFAASRIKASRSSVVNIRFFIGRSYTAQINLSNNLAARLAISMCPLWMGSNEPGYTAMFNSNHLCLSRTLGLGFSTADVPADSVQDLARTLEFGRASCRARV